MKDLQIKVLESWSKNHISVAGMYYTDREIAHYVDRVCREMDEAELQSELLHWTMKR